MYQFLLTIKNENHSNPKTAMPKKKVKVWWVTRLKSKVSRPFFSLVIVAGDMIHVGKNGLAGVRKLVKRVCEAD